MRARPCNGIADGLPGRPSATIRSRSLAVAPDTPRKRVARMLIVVQPRADLRFRGRRDVSAFDQAIAETSNPEWE